jgi:hypothetical protein
MSNVTTLWMAGVVVMMLIFGVIAAYGYFRQSKH